MFQTTNNIILPPMMTSEMVESAWVWSFYPPSRPENTKNSKKT